jgi:hypothetical protein
MNKTEKRCLNFGAKPRNRGVVDDTLQRSSALRISSIIWLLTFPRHQSATFLSLITTL